MTEASMHVVPSGDAEGREPQAEAEPTPTERLVRHGLRTGSMAVVRLQMPEEGIQCAAREQLVHASEHIREGLARIVPADDTETLFSLAGEVEELAFQIDCVRDELAMKTSKSLYALAGDILNAALTSGRASVARS